MVNAPTSMRGHRGKTGHTRTGAGRTPRVQEAAAPAIDRMLSVVVRPLRASELLAIQRTFPAGGPEKHSARLWRQEAGEASYLIAWVEARPVGHLFLLWAGPDHDDMRSRLPRLAAVEDLYVLGDVRGRGIGTRLLAAAESLVHLRGISRIGLGVSVDNFAAARLYRRLGFLDSGAGHFVSRWVEPDRYGVSRHFSETLVFLVKEMRS